MEASFEVDPESYEFGRDVSEYSIAARQSVEFEQFDDDDFDVDPITATEAKPGSNAKVQMLSARYAAGLPLWHHEDCDEHGPGEPDLKGSVQEAAEEPFALVLDEFASEDDEDENDLDV